MEIGLLKEIKTGEGRVALTPDAVGALVDAGHNVYVEHNAGLASGFEDFDYRLKGACCKMDATAIWNHVDLIVKVKEPRPEEFKLFKPGLKLLSYLHLAADPDLLKALTNAEVDWTALEDVEHEGHHPALDPMSIIAGRLAVNLAIHQLLYPNKGSGILIGGVPNTTTGFGVVLGGGVSGMAAANEMLKHNMDVVVFDVDPAKIAKINYEHRNQPLTAKYSVDSCIGNAIEHADIVIGAVLIPGKKAPVVIKQDHLDNLRKGSVVVDIAIDQGGCVENIMQTSWDMPSYNKGGINYIAIPNLPGAVPRTASTTLSDVVLPQVMKIGK